MRLEDGKGKGTYAEVNEDGELITFAIGIPEFSDHSQDYGTAYTIPTTIMAATTTEGMMLYVQNTNDTKRFLLESMLVSCNGGNTNFNRTVIFRIYANPSAPSANTTAITPPNMNFTSSNKATITAYQWNGTGTGMTTASNGTLLVSRYQTAGINLVPWQGSIVIGANQSIGISLAGASETTNCLLTLVGSFQV